MLGVRSWGKESIKSVLRLVKKMLCVESDRANVR